MKKTNYNTTTTTTNSNLITYTFKTSNKTLLQNQLSYITNNIIPYYTENNYFAQLSNTTNNSFTVITNCPYIYNSDPIGNYTYTETYTKNGETVLTNKYHNGIYIH